MILSRTIAIPRSSDAFNSSTRFRKLSGLHENNQGNGSETKPDLLARRVVVQEPGLSRSSQFQVVRRTVGEAAYGTSLD